MEEQADTTRSWSVPCSLEHLTPLGTFHDRRILSDAECASIIQVAETSEKWRQRGEYLGHTTVDIDAMGWLGESMAPRFLPPLSRAFQARDAKLSSLRIVKYVGGSRCAGLPLHSDGTPLSFICVLNACAEAGTYVRALNAVLSPTTGHALLFCGRWFHAGVPVPSGTVRYVMTGFVNASFEPRVEAALEHLAAQEMGASIAWRLCPARRWLRREFDGLRFDLAERGTPRACTSCGALVPSHAVRHCCEHPGCCGAQLCDACVWASSPRSICSSFAADDGAAGDGAADDGDDVTGSMADGFMDAAAGEHAYTCAFVGDVSLPEGSILEAGAVVRKAWRLSMECRAGGVPWPLDDPHRRPRLIRSDHDCDESIGSRCLGEDALSLCRLPVRVDAEDHEHEEEGYVDAAVELIAPTLPGTYRLFFRLVVGDGALPMLGTDELTASFIVVA